MESEGVDGNEPPGLANAQNPLRKIAQTDPYLHNDRVLQGAMNPMLGMDKSPFASTISDCWGQLPSAPRRRISAQIAVDRRTTISWTDGIVV